MAKSIKPAALIATEHDEESAIPPLEVETDEEQDELQNIIEQLGGVGGSDATLKVYRFNPETREREFCFNARGDEARTLDERLAEIYNGGKFEVVLYTPSATGAARRKVVTLKIAKRADWKPPAEKNQPAAPDMMQFMREMSDRQNAMVSAIMEAGRDQLREVVEKLRTQPGQGDSMEKTLDLITKVKTAFGEPARASGGVAEVIETMAAVEKIKQMVAGDDKETGGGITDALREGIGFLKEIVVESRARRMASAPASTGHEEHTAMQFKKEMRGYIGELCKLAAAGRNPVSYADVMLDKVPEQYYGNIGDLLGDDDEQAVINLMEIEPRVNDFKPWFAEFCAAVRAALTPDDLTSEPDELHNKAGQTGNPDARTANSGDDRGHSD